MQLPPELHTRLASEYRFAAIRMSETSNPYEKLYYFSVFFGEAGRILNWQWDRNLSLIWLVTQQVQQQISACLSVINKGEPVIRVSTELFEALTTTASELADYIERKGTDEELNSILGRFSELSYATTGNGYYLLQQGRITLD